MGDVKVPGRVVKVGRGPLLADLRLVHLLERPVAQLLRPHPEPQHDEETADDHQDERGQQGREHRLPANPLPRPPEGADRTGPDRLVAQIAGQIVRQVLGRGIAFPRLLLQALQADDFEIARHPGPESSRRNRVVVLDVLQRIEDGFADERRPTRQHVVKDGAEGVDVDARAEAAILPLGLLRGHVGGRP